VERKLKGRKKKVKRVGEFFHQTFLPFVWKREKKEVRKENVHGNGLSLIFCNLGIYRAVEKCSHGPDYVIKLTYTNPE